MKQELSILIPVYNTVCIDTVRILSQQCERIRLQNTSFHYEIVVADDASTDTTCIEHNRQIADLPSCRFIEKETNTGSASTRNFLARSSQYQWLLFLDCDMQITDDELIARYLNDNHTAQVVNGGIRIGNCEESCSNLRYIYEKQSEPNHTAEKRSLRPYHCFRSTNFLIRREIMLDCPFDERFLKSGYEDVLLGKQLKQRRVSVAHIDTPTTMTDFENNPDYMAKIERSLRTLHTFRSDLSGFSPLLTLAEGIHIGPVRTVIRLWHKVFGPIERRWLCGKHPNLTVFKLYKLGYYLSLTKND